MVQFGMMLRLSTKKKSYCTSALSCTYVDKGGVDVLFIWIRRPQEHPSTVHCSIKRETTVNNQKYIQNVPRSLQTLKRKLEFTGCQTIQPFSSWLIVSTQPLFEP